VGGILCNYGFLIWRWHKRIAILLSSPAELSVERLVTQSTMSKYCNGDTEVPQKHPMLGNSLIKHISAAMNACTTMDELLEVVFYILLGPPQRYTCI
jgi:hypothetical protein